MILPTSYETMLDKIKQDWFHLGWEAAMAEEQKWRARRGEQMVEFSDHEVNDPECISQEMVEQAEQEAEDGTWQSSDVLRNDGCGGADG